MPIGVHRLRIASSSVRVVATVWSTLEGMPMARPNMTRRRLCAARVATCGVLLCASCGDADYGPYAIVGGACRDAFDCAPGAQCERGGDFPEGTCTLPCRDHLDCPRGTACVDVHGGMCLIACGSD